MSENRKRKKAFYKGKYGGKKGKYQNDLRPKLKGFIITVNGQEKNARGEAYRLLNEYADKRYGPEQLDEAGKESGDESEQDIEASLKQEVSNIKAAKDKDRRFQIIQNKAKNVLFVKADVEDPNQLALDIFEDLSANSVAKTRHCCRLLPVIDTCYAKLNHIVEAAKPILKTLFTESQTPFSTYCMTWKVRCNDTLKRDEVYGELLEYIKQFEGDYEACYIDPDVVIDMNIIGNICCFGILRKWNQYSKYNLDAIVKKVNKEVNGGGDQADVGEEKAKNVETEAKASEENVQSIDAKSETGAESKGDNAETEAKAENDQPVTATDDGSSHPELKQDENVTNDESAKKATAQETDLNEGTHEA